MAQVTPSVVFKLGSFNCKNLSNKIPTKTKNIAHTIDASEADLVSLQEISSIEGFTSLLEELGDEWDGIYTEPLNNGGIPERMAFVYKKHKVQAIGAFTFIQAEKSAYVGCSNILTRAPGYGRFLVEGKDITMIAVHTFQKKPQYECRLITKMIKAIQATNKCNAIVVVGDFNLPCSDRYAFEKLVKAGYTPALDASQNTNITNTEQYDNIWINRKTCGMRESAKVCRDSIKQENYSDHCMIVVELELVAPLSEGARFFNPPSFEEGMKKSVMTRFRLGSLVCCGNSKIVCDCEY